MFTIERSSSGKLSVVIGCYKYRESHVLASGDVAWRCLGSTCKVSVKINTDRTSILVHKDVHTGRHPQTYRNVSPAHTQTRKTSTSIQLELEAEKIATRSRSSPKAVNVAVECEPEKSWISLRRRTLFQCVGNALC
ncbi:hypothetical protein J6590_061739 [Homalodisca vitripennis]|nr:hypothetical protein J6590_061733 [Homalodisca vitripennis]KAG8262007.1 hypothetical protein J6590_061739 [Homalodisca vitripennis]